IKAPRRGFPSARRFRQSVVSAIPDQTSVHAAPEAGQSFPHGDVRIDCAIVAARKIKVSPVEQVVDADTEIETTAEWNFSSNVKHRMARGTLFDIGGRYPFLGSVCD